MNLLTRSAIRDQNENWLTEAPPEPVCDSKPKLTSPRAAAINGDSEASS